MNGNVKLRSSTTRNENSANAKLESIIKNIILISISLFLFSCTDPIPLAEPVGSDFSIYLLQDETINAAGAFSQPVENLKLADPAFLTVKDFKSYVWSSHTFELTEKGQIIFEQFRLARGKTSGVPFVVTVGGERIYIGTFWWAYSSGIPPACAVIEVIAPLPYRINLANGASDKRSDPKIYDSLKKSKILVE